VDAELKMGDLKGLDGDLYGDLYGVDMFLFVGLDLTIYHISITSPIKPSSCRN
jgi:hypothetical protein